MAASEDGYVRFEIDAVALAACEMLEGELRGVVLLCRDCD